MGPLLTLSFWQPRALQGLQAATVIIALATSACSTSQAEAPAATDATAESVGSTPSDATSANAPANLTNTTAPRAASAPAAAPKPKVVRLNAGHRLTVRTTRALSTKTMHTGDAFSAILEEPISAAGWVAAASGSRVEGRIVEADKGGRLKGKANLAVELTSLTTRDGEKIDIVTSPVTAEAAANRGKDAAKIGVAAGAGAAIGAVAGGGKGAAIGGLIGGGAGTALRGEAAEIPAETVLSFELRSPVTIRQD